MNSKKPIVVITGASSGIGKLISIKLAKKKNLVCIYIGDAAIEEGTFFESINFCVLKKLPVIFICENNFFSVYSALSKGQSSKRKIINPWHTTITIWSGSVPMITTNTITMSSV